MKDKCKMDLIVHGKKSETCAQIEPQVSKPKQKVKGFLNSALTRNKGVQGSTNTPLRKSVYPIRIHRIHMFWASRIRILLSSSKKL